MTRVIQIKRKAAIPQAGDLKEGELGYDLLNRKLYVGNGAEPPSPVRMGNDEITTSEILHGDVDPIPLDQLLADIEPKVVSHELLLGAATHEPTPNTLIVRDINGHAQIEDPEMPYDIVNKRYVEAVLQGLNGKKSVLCATVDNVILTGNTYQIIDGVTLTPGCRVLVKDQTDKSQNGIYEYNPTGDWERAADVSTWEELVSAYVFVEQGIVNRDTGWQCIIDKGGTLEQDDIVWTIFSRAGEVTITGQSLINVVQNGSMFTISHTQGVQPVVNQGLSGINVVKNIEFDEHRHITKIEYGLITTDEIESATTFRDLEDTPINYSNSAGKLVAVKETEDGLEYIDTLDCGSW